MGHRATTTWTKVLCIVLVSLLVAQSNAALAVQRSSLSKWLSKQVVPELREHLARHPLYQKQKVVVVNAPGDSLSEAIVTVLLRSFPGKYGVQLQANTHSRVSMDATASTIDGLPCADAPGFDYQLLVSATGGPTGGEVQLQLTPVQDQATVTDDWRWDGRFSKAELAYLGRQAQMPSRNGSMAAPWQESDTEAAARALSREFACALRPQLQTRLTLGWKAQSAMPGVFSDTVNISRHLLASYRELSLATADAAAAFAVDVRLVPLRENIWQLWLSGTPRQPGLTPVQAVTYFHSTSAWPQSQPQPKPKPQPKPQEDPLDFLGVTLLDTTQSDGPGSTAQLQITLQLANHAPWAMDYSFTVSGGHFLHCIASAGYYRHDRYGSLAGSLAAGQSVRRQLVIDKAEHRPTPVFGTRKCAGVRDLEGFEEFSRQGYKVTDYVRWKSALENVSEGVNNDVNI